MTIAIPLIALVVLLVVWAKCCPEIVEPKPKRYTTIWYFPMTQVEAVEEFGRLKVSFKALADSAFGATRAITVFTDTYRRPDES